jgi:hypothetical protein
MRGADPVGETPTLERLDGKQSGPRLTCGVSVPVSGV